MRSRAVVLVVGLMVTVLLLAGAAQASPGDHDHHGHRDHDGHHGHRDRDERRGGGHHNWNNTIAGEVGKAPRHHRPGHRPTFGDALRYVGRQHGKHHWHRRHHSAADYLRADPFIVTMPDRRATTFKGWIKLDGRMTGSVATIGLVDLASLKDGQSGRQEGAFIYVFARPDGRLRVGVTDGNINEGELVQASRIFAVDEVPEKIWVEFTVERTDDPAELKACATHTDDLDTADGCMSLVINRDAPIKDSFGSITAEGFDDEFARGAVPGWEAYPPGDTTGIAYALRVTPAYAR